MLYIMVHPRNGENSWCNARSTTVHRGIVQSMIQEPGITQAIAASFFSGGHQKVRTGIRDLLSHTFMGCCFAKLNQILCGAFCLIVT